MLVTRNSAKKKMTLKSKQDALLSNNYEKCRENQSQKYMGMEESYIKGILFPIAYFERTEDKSRVMRI